MLRKRDGGTGPQPPARQPRLIRTGRSWWWRRPSAGEKGAGWRGPRLPVGARTKPQLRLLCPFQTAFVPITSGPAAIWAEAARTALGPRPSLLSALPFRSFEGLQIRLSQPSSLSGRMEFEVFQKVTGHRFLLLPKLPPEKSPNSPPPNPNLDASRLLSVKKKGRGTGGGR